MRICQKKGTMHKKNKMQNNKQKNRVKSQPGSIAQVSQPCLLGFHAAATAFPTIFQFLHRILARKFVGQFFLVLSQILNNGFEMTGAQRTTRSRVRYCRRMQVQSAPKAH